MASDLCSSTQDCVCLVPTWFVSLAFAVAAVRRYRYHPCAVQAAREGGLVVRGPGVRVCFGPLSPIDRGERGTLPPTRGGVRRNTRPRQHAGRLGEDPQSA